MRLRPRVRFLPEGKEGGGILPSVVAVMVFLSMMAVATGISAHNAAASWGSDLNGTATLQIVTSDRQSRERQAELALDLLRRTPGIAKAESLSDEELAGLLEPWLGTGNVTADLPVPALIAITLSPGAKIDLAALNSQIRKIAPDARLDDQQEWINELSRLAQSVQVAAIAAVLMIFGATVAIVIFATRARLASHREDVVIVHTMGAEDRMIAEELRYRFLIYGLKGSGIGAALGAVALFAIHYFGQQVGGGLAPQLVLGGQQYLFLVAVPLAAAALSTLTASITTMRALSEMV